MQLVKSSFYSSIWLRIIANNAEVLPASLHGIDALPYQGSSKDRSKQEHPNPFSFSSEEVKRCCNTHREPEKSQEGLKVKVQNSQPYFLILYDAPERLCLNTCKLARDSSKWVILR